MDEKTSITVVINKLESLFSKLNVDLFNNQLPKPIITVSPDTTKGAYGWCTSRKVWQDKDEQEYYEINLCAEHLNREYNEICSTLIHEMIHLENLELNIKDTSRAGTYHNKKFKVAAESHGMIVEETSYGWSRTSLTEKLKELINSYGKMDFTLYRSKFTNPSKKSSTRRYVCPSCGIVIRATKEVRIICSDCDIELIND